MLVNLEYPFHKKYPLKFISKIRWKLNEWKFLFMPFLNLLRCKFTILDGFGAPGDTLLTATVAHNVKRRYPYIKLNIITANPDLLKYDSNIDLLNHSESYFSEKHWYLDIITDKNANTNVIEPTLKKIGIRDYNYKAKIYLSTEEKKWANNKIDNLAKPLIAINSLSKEEVKNWPLPYWKELISDLKNKAKIIHLGDNREPDFEGVNRFAGKTTLREAMAILSQCDLFIGPDSFLSHVANGLDVKSIIIFGGSRTAQNLGYKENINLVNYPECSPCWIHPSLSNDKCLQKLKCMTLIKPSEVKATCESILFK